MSSKAKAKKERIRAETKMLNEKRAIISEALLVQDYLSIVPSFRHYNKDDLHAELIAYNQVPDEHEEWMFHLVETNMKAFYESSFGWDQAIKEGEFYHPDSRFILAFVEGHPFAFIHFRFEVEASEAGAFIYDIHVEPELKRKHVGKLLLQSVELISLKLKMDVVKVLLFKDNIEGRQFFRAMHYVQHSTSPAVVDPQGDIEYDHEILAKTFKRPPPKPQ